MTLAMDLETMRWVWWESVMWLLVIVWLAHPRPPNPGNPA
jgi:hypothetical protein